MHRPITPFELGARHRRRVRSMLWLGAGVMTLMGLGWSIFFGLTGAWFFVALIAVFIAVGLGVGVLTYLRRTRLASYIFIAGSFLIVCAVAWVLDVPSAQELLFHAVRGTTVGCGVCGAAGGHGASCVTAVVWSG